MRTSNNAGMPLAGRHLALILAAATVASASSNASADEKSWNGETVMPIKPTKDIQFGDWIDGKQVYYPLSQRVAMTVRDDREGWLRIHDGHREGWVDKADFVLVRDAPAYFDRLVNADPTNTYALHMRGSGWLQKGEPDNAIMDFDACIRLEPTVATLFNSRGRAWAAKKAHDKAIEDYSEAVRLDPRDALPFNNRGLARFAKKEYDRAIRDYDEAIRLDPKYLEAFNNRGVAWLAKKEFDRAIRDYDEAFRLDPKHPVVFNNRGYAWSDKTEYDKAIRDYDQAVRLNPRYAIAFNNRGNAWQYKKEYDRAIRDYDEAVRLDPRYALAHFNRSATRMLLRRPEAAPGFQGVIDLQGWKGDLAPYAVIFGDFAARQAGNEATARRFLKDSAGKLDEAWPYPAIQFRRGEIDEAALLRLATDDDKRTEARCYLGLDHALHGRKDEALAHFRWVKAHGTRTLTEYVIAVAELERLEAFKR